jgi:large subunit ribosomal protein L25
MADYTLIAEGGRAIGSRSSGRLRLAGRVPAVLYGHSSEPLAISVDGRELRHALSTDAGLNQLLNLEVDGTRHLALARELQRHPVRNTVVHVDFQIVGRDEVISAEVPLTLVGEAKEVEVLKGLIEQPLLSLTINATPGAIPSAVEIDISQLQIGDQIRVSDLVLPAGVTTDVDPEETVVMAVARALEAEEGDEAAPEVGADGADGAA